MARIICLIDMQRDFIDGSLGTPEAKNAVQNAIKWLKDNFRERDKLYLTKDTHYMDYLSTMEGKHLPVEHCIVSTEGWRIWPDLYKLIKNDITDIFDKHTFGSSWLIGTIYDAIIHANEENPIDEIIFMGLCTDICVITNVLMMQETLENRWMIPIKVIANCCAGTTPAKHNAALEVMKSCQIDVI